MLKPLIFQEADPPRFIYKFKYLIDKKEDILEYLADEDGALEINEDVLESYDKVKEDIEVLLSSLPLFSFLVSLFDSFLLDSSFGASDFKGFQRTSQDRRHLSRPLCSRGGGTISFSRVAILMYFI